MKESKRLKIWLNVIQPEYSAKLIRTVKFNKNELSDQRSGKSIINRQKILGEK